MVRVSVSACRLPPAGSRGRVRARVRVRVRVRLSLACLQVVERAARGATLALSLRLTPKPQNPKTPRGGWVVYFIEMARL